MSEQTMPEKTEPMATAQPEDGVQQAEGRTADRVLDVKTCEGKRRFLVKWKGCPDSEDSWEPEENLDSTHLIEEFLNRQIRNQKQSKHADTMTAAKEKKVKNDDQKVDKDADEPSFQPERVVGAGQRSGQLVFLMEWDSGVLCQISAKKANVKYPQIVIAFYESIMVWDTSKETDTGL